MNSLVDTNIFLQILLNQPATQKCEHFLNNDPGAGWISDFSLHSIGVLLFRRGRVELFGKVISDLLPNLAILRLSNAGYDRVIEARKKFALDFDDAYQFCVAKENGLAISTQDRDFERVKHELNIVFI